MARALAAEVLASPAVVLAMRVLAGGPHAVAAAIELARRDAASPPPTATINIATPRW